MGYPGRVIDQRATSASARVNCKHPSIGDELPRISLFTVTTGTPAHSKQQRSRSSYGMNVGIPRSYFALTGVCGMARVRVTFCANRRLHNESLAAGDYFRVIHDHPSGVRLSTVGRTVSGDAPNAIRSSDATFTPSRAAPAMCERRSRRMIGPVAATKLSGKIDSNRVAWVTNFNRTDLSARGGARPSGDPHGTRWRPAQRWLPRRGANAVREPGIHVPKPSIFVDAAPMDSGFALSRAPE